LHQESQREPLFLPFNLQDIDETSQMRSGFPGNVDTSAHHAGQFLTFEGQTCSLGKSFTRRAMKQAGKKREG
jgi:hypothetical protein